MFRRWCLGIMVVCLAAMNIVTLAKLDPYVELPDTDWGDIAAPQPVWSSEAAVAHYGRLEAGGDVDAFAFTFDAPRPAWSFSLVVPVCGAYFKNVYPSAALIGMGLPADTAEGLPFEVPDGMGAQVFEVSATDDLARLSGEGEVGLNVYAAPLFFTDIPQAGSYTLAIWEPTGKVGAYVLATGTQHDQFAKRTNNDIEAAFNAVFSGAWMGLDCNRPPSAVCPPTTSHGGAADIPQVELRAKVGEGFVLSGQVLDAADCQPVSGAKVTFWLVNEDGLYDDAHQGAVLTEADGSYQISSNRPVPYTQTSGSPPPAHIHMAVTAEGYDALVTEYIWQEADVEGADFPLVLRQSS